MHLMHIYPEDPFESRFIYIFAQKFLDLQELEVDEILKGQNVQ